MLIPSPHGDTTLIKNAYRRVVGFFKDLKSIAPQLTIQQCWYLILAKAMEKFKVKITNDSPNELTAFT